LQLDGGKKQILDLPYDDDKKWEILETVVEGNLETTERINFQYHDRDILCIEMLQLESIEENLKFDIIQVSPVDYIKFS